MKVKELAHIGICVRNLEKSIDFYENVMGFQVVSGPTDLITSEAEGKGMGFDCCTYRNCIVEIIPGQCLELLEFSDPKTPEGNPCPINFTGKHHVAYMVDDIFQWVEKFRQLGLPVVSDPLEDEASESPIYWVYVKDPDGIAIELMQIKK